MIEKFLRSPIAATPYIRKPTPITNLVAPNPLIGLYPEIKYSPIYHTGGNWRSLPHITNQCLPTTHLDIKGVDSAAYVMLNRRTSLKTFPKLMQNRFFSLRYIPLNHFLASARKSNIAYTFTNSQVDILNSPQLASQFKTYKGSYKSLPYFQTLPAPMSTAFARTKYRKLVKKALHEALHTVVPNNEKGVARVSGVYMFKFSAVPTTKEEIQSIRDNLVKAITKVYGDETFRQSLQLSVGSLMKSGDKKTLLKSILRENTIDAHEVPGYIPKLPFLIS